jgi:ABC-type bacteriocin/lantibiotic exporter with double-glycine peptidase domain
MQLVAVALAATTLAGARKLRLERGVMAEEGRLSGLVFQLVCGVAKLRTTGAEERAYAQWAGGLARQKKLTLESGRVDNKLTVFGMVFPLLATMALFAITVKSLHGSDGITTGAFVAFSAAFSGFLTGVLTLGASLLSVLSIVPLYERAKPVLASLPEDDASKADCGELVGRIEVDHVTFRYHSESAPVLSDVSIAVEAGEFVAIVGPSGSGKSTLLRLLLGLEMPERGAVLYDQKRLVDLDLHKLRQKIGVVMQSARVRHGSMLQNIVGMSARTEEDAWEAARIAGLDEDIRQMPMNMHTMLQQGGGTLSGGQRQRLMIARAVVARPRVLFFDEATSALDNRTQALVNDRLRQISATRVAIAHRLSTIVAADRIYVMEAGRIVQAGTYDVLMAEEGLFRQLVKRQVG